MELASGGPGDFEFVDGNSELAGRRPGRAHGPGREMKAQRAQARCVRGRRTTGRRAGVGRDIGGLGPGGLRLGQRSRPDDSDNQRLPVGRAAGPGRAE